MLANLIFQKIMHRGPRGSVYSADDDTRADRRFFIRVVDLQLPLTHDRYAWRHFSMGGNRARKDTVSKLLGNGSQMIVDLFARVDVGALIQSRSRWRYIFTPSCRMRRMNTPPHRPVVGAWPQQRISALGMIDFSA
jgi:hypothetical protein